MSDAAQQLWRLWQQGQQPDLRTFLTRTGKLSNDQLLAVVRVDQQQRWQRGDRVAVEEYFRLCPALQTNTEDAVLLVYGEFLFRKQLDETPAPEEYLRRFPQYAGQLRLQFELHEVLQTEGSSSGNGEAPSAGDSRLSVPGYELREELGRGSTGIVFKARRISDDLLVALKVLRADVRLGTQERARFRAEGEAVSRLRHPNVVQIYEVGECLGRPYLALEFVAGGNLARRVAEGPLPILDAVRMVQTLSRAVQHVHEHGVLHRDLNPANVLLTPDGTPKIGDFGLAKLLLRDHVLTRSGTVLGTPGYMAPEQADGRTREICPATDVHALGAILYHLLTGRPPYDEGSVVPTLLKVRSDEMPSPVQLARQEVSAALDRLCMRCLSKEPAGRYPTALALAEELAGFLSPDRSQASQPPGVYLVIGSTGEEFRLSTGQTVLGRSSECDLRVQAPQASRRHCRILCEGDQVVIEDLGSTGGTEVNGEHVQRARLQDGDRLEIGGETFLVQIVPEVNSVGPPRERNPRLKG